MTSKPFKKKILPVIFWIVTLTSFTFAAFLIILKANGYQLNSHTWKIEKTGLIILDGRQTIDQVIVNGKIIEKRFPVKLSNLIPRTYEVTVKKSDYQSWEKSIQVEAGRAADFENILLFLNEPKSETVDQAKYTKDKITENYLDNSKGIVVNKGELIYNGQLVTRFSQDILAAIIFPDRNHFVFQVGDNIRVIDADGSNNINLTKLSSSTPTVFYVNNNQLIYLDGQEVIVKTIY